MLLRREQAGAHAGAPARACTRCARHNSRRSLLPSCMCVRARVQYWRLLTNFMYFGNWGIDFLFNMYFLCVPWPV